MKQEPLSTQSYKGVRDFYPEDMAVERYIFDTWSQTAERFGFERYDASILEPAELYKAKGAENEELVNEQTYTFRDRGDREVTLRPEMTPTVARLIAGRRHQLSFPVRWYSIPNLFRYERPQRGRLREHWQLNCDIFGSSDYTTDVEIIALANQILLDFGATSEMFEIRVNNRYLISEYLKHIANKSGKNINDEQISQTVRLNDRIKKITQNEYLDSLSKIFGESLFREIANAIINDQPYKDFESKNSVYLSNVVNGLRELGISNVKSDISLARGFDYYTGTIFEIFDVSGENNRAMLGGGRYDNLTGLFGGEPITGIGFGMGDVTMRDFLETHQLIPTHIRQTAPTLIVIPHSTEDNLGAHKLAHTIRQAGVSAAVDTGTKKLGKKIGDASDRGARFIIVVGESERASGTYTVKELARGVETRGDAAAIIATMTA